MRIEELMTSGVLSVRTDETADVAARLLSRSNVGAVPVVDEEERPVGMLTDRDLVVRCMAAGLRPEEVAVDRIMTPGPVTAEAQEELEAVCARMGQAQVRRVPVVREGRLAGIVSLADVAKADATGAMTALGLVSGNVSRR